ncbi:hypothetical protein PBT90_13415 [Algoriphagus halophytocola]|uniref:Uncharacterized protein n=1 Tax=Algoriphagus halophytocola TaxID=2991499 RepID=A0ABY6MPT3_9BACT|nr:MULTISPECIES: hypothetical protein [unclassified Algoriphagus]UZD24384.1 hypothetical protein OM944_07745 [Algoriphagus sp. TR-M5]WBL41752.1 hypothetical protein PBT90_13415 [Algoriphagus sp. TR-M9]
MKSSKFIFYIIVVVVAALVMMIAKESFFQPGMERFDGKYEELGSYRNENNTGPILRLYAVKALDKDTQWMREYGDALPHTKYGKTIVYFFSEEINQDIALQANEPHFPQEFTPFLIATYYKKPMGDVSFAEANPK